MKTFIPNAKTMPRKWYIVDASTAPLGRLATFIADTLRGKNKPTFTPSQDTGDYVIVINAEQVVLTGKKETDKIYYRHSGYLGGLKKEAAGKLRERKPEKIIFEAVRGMIPRTRLYKPILAKLHIYSGAEHPHEAQQPEELI